MATTVQSANRLKRWGSEVNMDLVNRQANRRGTAASGSRLLHSPVGSTAGTPIIGRVDSS